MPTSQLVGSALLVLALVLSGVAAVAFTKRRRKAERVRAEAINLLGDLATDSAKAQSELENALAGIRSDEGPGLAEKLPQLALTSRLHQERLGTAQEGLERLAGTEQPLAAAAVEVARQRDRVGQLCRTAESASAAEPEVAVAAVTHAVSDVLRHERAMRDTIDDAKDRLESRAARLAGAERDPSKDPLTKLPNRRTFLEQAGRPNENGTRSPYSIAVFAVNIGAEVDSGPAVGDAVVLVAARVLKESVRPGDLIARTGTREFAVLMPGVDSGTASYIARGCRRASKSAGVRLGDRTISFALTWGVATSRPDLTPEAALAESREAQSQTLTSDPGRLLSGSAGTVARPREQALV